MKQEIAEKWVAALRSGEYEQTQQALCRVDVEQGTRGFCCLGVLCDMFAEEHLTVSKWKRPTDITEVGFLLADRIEFFAAPPTAVRDWAELKSCVGACDSSEELKTAFVDHFELSCNDDSLARGPSLASANDGGATFEQIANFIEQHWENL